MKRLTIIIIFVFVILLTGCTRQKTERIIEKISQNSNFEYELLTVVTEDVTSKFNIMGGFGVETLIDANIDPYSVDIYEYMLSNPTTYYDVTAYPDYANGGSYITRISTSDPEIHIYDLSVGDEYTEVEIIEYMESLGFYPRDSISSVYVNERVWIRVYLEEGIIIKLGVEVEITNRTGIEY
ncbi:MAG: hypothetical protein KKH01_01740 [Firmicutes bacterium]|nr:hypothetical protein [Bacillota bacterium]